MIELALIAASGLTVMVYARWLVLTARAKEASTSFTLDFIPFTSDVAATEAALPRLAGDLR